MIPFTSLTAATSTQAGTAKDLEDSVAVHTMIVTVTGSPTSVSVNLEGSHDNVNWVNLTTYTSTSSGYVSFDSQVRVRYVRANLTAITGGSSPTITASIGSSLDR